MLHVLNTGIASAKENMYRDAKLLEQLDIKGDPILHLYDWADPSATYGYFIEPEDHLDLQKAKLHQLDLARRPTGGGIVFHIWDLAFSFLMPSGHPYFSFNTLQNYQFVNEVVLQTVQDYFTLELQLISQDAPSISPNCRHFCMAKPTQYDVMYRGMKIAGAAQRKRRQGYLHQGTISLMHPDLPLLSDVLLSKQDVVQAMTAFTFAPLKKTQTLKQVRRDLEKLLADKLNGVLKS